LPKEEASENIFLVRGGKLLIAEGLLDEGGRKVRQLPRENRERRFSPPHAARGLKGRISFRGVQGILSRH